MQRNFIQRAMGALFSMQSMVGGGAPHPLHYIWPTLGIPLDRPGRLNPSYRKKGPGRVHCQGTPR